MHGVAFAVLVLLSSVSSYIIPRQTVPSTYDQSILEPYANYHCRYLAIGCQNQHNTAFFDSCCHPLKTGETVAANRPAQCQLPAGSTCPSDGSAAPPPTTPPPTTAPAPADSSDEDDGDCDDSDDDGSSDDTPAPAPAPPAAPPAPSPSPADQPAPAPSPADQPAPPPAPENAAPAPPAQNAAPAPPPPAPAAPAPPASDDGGDFNTGGQATFFFQNGNPGACGTVHQDSDFIAAMDERRFGTSGPGSPLCGKQVLIINTNNNKQVTVTIADDCPTCSNSNSIDLSTAAFNSIANPNDGVAPIKWKFL